MRVERLVEGPGAGHRNVVGSDQEDRQAWTHGDDVVAKQHEVTEC
jgi:hypothetical protein